MPTYQYTCDACGEEFEKFQSITAAAIRTCPHCGKPKARRLISGGAGIIFKGSGFYATDYRSDGYKSAAKADSGGNGSPSTDKPATKESSKSTSAPAKKPVAARSTPSPAGKGSA